MDYWLEINSLYQLWFLWFATCSYFLKEDAKGLGTLVFIQWLGLDHFSLATAITPSFFLFRNKEKNIRSYSTHEIQGTKSCYRNVRNILIFFFFSWNGHTFNMDTLVTQIHAILKVEALLQNYIRWDIIELRKRTTIHCAWTIKK